MTLPDSERNAKALEITAEVTKKYQESWAKAVSEAGGEGGARCTCER